MPASTALDPSTMEPSLPPSRHLHSSRLTPIYTTSRTRLLLFDYDGTLTPIVRDPASATLTPSARHQLTLLASSPQNEVWIISGRSCAFLAHQLGDISPRLGLCAEHGVFIRYPGSSSNSIGWQDLGQGEDMTWRPLVSEIFQGLQNEVEGSEMELKQAALVWHYRRAVDLDLAAIRAGEVAEKLRGSVVQKWPVEVVEGKCVVEVRARALHKGQVAETLLEDRRKKWDFVACWGDDRTDEDMFRSLAASHLPEERVFSIKVGDGSVETGAKYIVADPEEVLRCIRWLTDADDAAEHCSPCCSPVLKGQSTDSKDHCSPNTSPMLKGRSRRTSGLEPCHLPK